MRKEVVLAVLMGFVLGLVIAGGIFLFGKSGIRLSSSPTVSSLSSLTRISPSLPTGSQVPLISPASPITLTLASPEDESIVKEDKVSVEGKTAPSATVSLIYENGESLITADEDGNFSESVPLIGGANEITITAFGEEGNEATQTVTVVYTTAEI